MPKDDASIEVAAICWNVSFQGLVLVPRHGYRVIRKQAWLISGFCGTIRLLEKRHAMPGIEMHGIEL